MNMIIHLPYTSYLFFIVMCFSISDVVMSVAGDILDADDEMLTSSFGGSTKWSYGQVC